MKRIITLLSASVMTIAVSSVAFADCYVGHNNGTNGHHKDFVEHNQQAFIIHGNNHSDCRVFFTVSGDVLFNSGSYKLKGGIGDILNVQAKEMITEGGDWIIEGHTDSHGSAKANHHLGHHRAAAVINYLAKQGVPRSSMKEVSYGEDRPVENNDTAAGRSQNRRISIVKLPN